jgi:hypothetical protein
MSMGFFSSIGTFVSGIAEKAPDPTTKPSLFKDFDAERERLQDFDLEASVESKPKSRAQAQRSDSGQS